MLARLKDWKTSRSNTGEKKGEIMRKAVKIIAITVFVCAGIFCTLYRFRFPDKTQTRIFLDLWPIVLITLACVAPYVYYVLRDNDL